MNVFFYISESVKGMFKARIAAALSITSIALTILLIGLFLIFNQNLNNWLGSVREKIEIEVFVEPGADDDEIDKLRRTIEQEAGVLSTEFVSKEKAAEIFEKEFGQDVYDILDYNPLPAKFVVLLKEDFRNFKGVTKISSKINQLSFVDEVVYHEPLISLIDRYITTIYTVIISIGFIITFIAITLIYNTIRLTVYARKEIIQIMRLVGATEGFIKKPFIIEGILQGLIGAGIASLILFYSLKIVKTFIYPYLVYNYNIFIFLLGFGFLIGMFSARLSVGKYLRNV